MRRNPLLFLTLALALLLTSSPTPASDALLDAKRDAAAKLLKDGKTADAQKLYEEIIATDATTWSDHYALAKIYDKAGETGKAVEAYHRVSKLLKNNTRSSAERSALAESEKRLDSLDQTTKKADQAFSEFSKSLELLAKEAERTKNVRLMERIQILQRALAQAGVSGTPFALKVPANSAAVDTGFDLEVGDIVQIAARGTWSTKAGDAAFDSGPEGLMAIAPANGLPIGVLLARIGTDGPVLSVGRSAEIRSERQGRLYLLINDAGKADNAGAIDVLIRRK